MKKRFGTKFWKQIALAAGTLVTMMALSVTALAAPSYAEWHYEKFGSYPDGTVFEWESDPVYWQYLQEYDPGELEEVRRRTNNGNSDADTHLYIDDVYWNGKTGKWDVDGEASKYQFRLYMDGTQVVGRESTASRSHNFSNDIKKSGTYWFEVRGYSRYGYYWTDWEESDSKYFDVSSGNNSSGGGPGIVVPSTPSGNASRWVGSGDNWQVRKKDGSGYVANSWWQDPATSEWYLIGCTNIPGRESYMSSGLFQDAAGNWYLLNPLHDGTFGKMTSGDANGNYVLNYNGQSIPIRFNKNHDGYYGRIISDVAPVKMVLGGSFQVSFVPPTAP